MSDQRERVCPSCKAVQDASNGFCEICSFPLHLIAGRYRIVKRLAAGGFGIIFLAEDTQQPRKVVVKVIKAQYLKEERITIRFHREIRLTQKMAERNKHAIQLYEHGSETELGYFFVMEYLQGRTLFEFLQQEQEISLEQGIHIFGQLCEVLDTAHQLGIIHRDLKPANIFLIERDGDPLFLKLLDFGLAKSLTDTVHEGLTQGMLGTPQYMAPEQCMNREVDARADIYATGLVLYELLMRAPAFDGDNEIKIATAQVSLRPDPFRVRRPDLTLPAALEGALMKALEKDPEHRYPQIRLFWEAIAPFASLTTISSLEISNAPNPELPEPHSQATIITDEPLPETSPPKPSLWGWILLLLSATLILGAGLFFLFAGRS